MMMCSVKCIIKCNVLANFKNGGAVKEEQTEKLTDLTHFKQLPKICTISSLDSVFTLNTDSVCKNKASTDSYFSRIQNMFRNKVLHMSF